MKSRICGTIFAVLISILLPLPSYADWRDTMIRVLGPPLINRGINYLLSRQRSTQRYQSYDQPNYQQPAYRPPAPSTVPPRKKPPAPHSVATSKGKGTSHLEIPPPPKTLVPPPPPAPPTGAVLGLYPPDMNEVPNKTQEQKPKAAPDYHRKSGV